MNHPQYTPEYLEAHAQRLRDDGAEDTAIGFEQCARLWRSDQVYIDQVQRENTSLQARLDAVRNQLQAVIA